MGETITVACADPKGIILRVFDMVEVREAVRDSGEKMITKAIEVGRIELKGYWSAIPQFMRKDAKAMHMQYGLTHGVDKDLFQRWYDANKDNPIVKNRVVWAHLKPGHAEGMALERVKEMAYRGSDPLDPTMLESNGRAVPKDPRYPRPPQRAGLDPLTSAER